MLIFNHSGFSLQYTDIKMLYFISSIHSLLNTFRTSKHRRAFGLLISHKNIACVNLVHYVVEAAVVAVGYDSVALGLELFEVV